MANKVEDMSTALEHTGDSPRVEDSQPSTDAPPPIAHEAIVTHASSPPMESPEPIEETGEPMQIEEDDSRGEGPMAFASIVDKGKAILIDDSGDNDHVTPIHGLVVEKSITLALEPTDTYTMTKASGIDYLEHLPLLLLQPFM